MGKKDLKSQCNTTGNEGKVVVGTIILFFFVIYSYFFILFLYGNSYVLLEKKVYPRASIWEPKRK